MKWSEFALIVSNKVQINQDMNYCNMNNLAMGIFAEIVFAEKKLKKLSRKIERRRNDED